MDRVDQNNFTTITRREQLADVMTRLSRNESHRSPAVQGEFGVEPDKRPQACRRAVAVLY